VGKKITGAAKNSANFRHVKLAQLTRDGLVSKSVVKTEEGVGVAEDSSSSSDDPGMDKIHNKLQVSPPLLQHVECSNHIRVLRHARHASRSNYTLILVPTCELIHIPIYQWTARLQAQDRTILMNNSYIYIMNCDYHCCN